MVGSVPKDVSVTISRLRGGLPFWLDSRAEDWRSWLVRRLHHNISRLHHQVLDLSVVSCGVALSWMADSEFSSVHWDSPPPTSLPDIVESSDHINNGLTPTSPPAQPVPPEMDPLQAPPSHDHILICVFSSFKRGPKCRLYPLRRKKRMERKMPMFRI